jgi:PAS domain S-box-containing protein
MADVWPESAGLPQNLVSCILQTRDGYVWAGTRAGMARFDGVRFTTFDDLKPDQLRESEVWALAEGADSALWVGTFGGGLARLEDGVFTSYSMRDGLPSDEITALARGPDGDLWVGTSAGLTRRRGDHFEGLPGDADLPGRRVTALHADVEGVVWIGMERGLASYSSGRFVNHTRAHPRALTGAVGSLAGDLQRGLWLALWRGSGEADNGLRLLERTGVTSFTVRDGLPSENVTSLAIEPDGTPCVGTLRGLYRFRGGRFDDYFASASLSGSRGAFDSLSRHGIPSLFVDRERNLWFGTRHYGLGRLRDTPFLDVHGADDVDVRVLLEDADGSMWLGTATDLRRIRDGTAEAFPMVAGLPANALARAGDGALLIGTPRGLYERSAGRIRRTRYAGTERLDVSVLFTDARRATWIGTRSDGAHRLSAEGLAHYTAREGLLGSEVRGIAEDRRGGIWIGTRDGGVSRLYRGRFATFGPEQGLAGPGVQAVFVDRDDDVWVATRQGLSRIRGERVASITARNGLPANYFYQIAEDDDGDFWLTHARGIARVAKRALNEVADGTARTLKAVRIGVESGMRSASMTVARQPTAWKARNGRLWFATAQGALVIDPRTSIRNTLPPPVHVEEVRAAGSALPARDGLTLPPSASEVEISYTGLSFVDPGRVLFKYRLEGFDEDWVAAGTRRTAYFTNLAPGAYRFRVIACNNDGVWNEEGASLSFRVLPLWYQRTQVRLLGVAAGALLVLGLHRRRTTQLRARERELSSRVAERTQALSELTASLEERVAERTAELAAANEALTAEKERLAVTLRSIGDGVIATDIEARVILMNRVAEQITGWEAAQAAGRPLGDVFHTIDRTSRMPLGDPTRSSRERAVPGGFTAPCLLIARDRREVLVADSAAPIRDPESRVIGAVLVFRDVTERDRMEEQLRNTQKLEALGVLAGGIAHDFNNLLTGVFGCVDVARVRSAQPSKAREALEKAMSVLDKARGLTRQLLTFAKAGEPIRRPLRLDQLVRDAVGFALSGSEVASDLQIADDLWPCEVDEQQISQVVDNLVLNARQAMASGGTLSVRLRNLQLTDDEVAPLPAGPHVCLSVSDRGPGIPYQLRARVFEPFFTTKPGGTGLGLATVHSIVRKHGGHVEVESEVGEGATFHVYLPARPDGVPGAPSARPEPAAGEGHGRILVMDDERYVREVARDSLECLGYEVLLACDDEEAVRLLRQAQDRGERVDAVILDLTIPGGHGGAAALQRLRSVAPMLPGIASSGYSGDGVMARPAEHGFSAALLKPYTIADLRLVLAQVLGRSRAAG